MRNVSKLITSACAVAAMLLSSQLKAQTTQKGKFNFAIGPNISLPTGNVKNYSHFL